MDTIGDKEMRNKAIKIKVSEKELEIIKKRAKEKQLSVSEYLRTLGIYGEVK